MWTREQRQEFANKLVLTAKMYDKEIGVDVARMVVDDLEDVDFNSCMEALTKFRKDPKNKFWPRAADIRALANPTLDSDTKGKLAAARAIEAIGKFGYANPEKAREFIGELGWSAVKKYGGWLFICENLGVSIPVSTFQAQLRDICISTDKAGKAGIEDQPIAISSQEREQIEGPSKVDVMKLLNDVRPSQRKEEA